MNLDENRIARRRSIALIFSFLIPIFSLAQTETPSPKPRIGMAILDPNKPLQTPQIQTCIGGINCENGTTTLNQEEKNKLTELMAAIKAGATAAQVTAVYGQPEILSLPTQAKNQPPNTLLSNGTWFVMNNKSDPKFVGKVSDSNVSVIFVNNSAVKFTWLTDGFKKRVTVTLTN